MERERIKSRTDMLMLLNELYAECKEELKEIGIELKKGITITIPNYNYKKYGCCKRKQHIEISQWVMYLNNKEIKNTIIHELLHTLDNTKGHCVKWKWYASKVNRKYGYDIQRLGNATNSFTNSNMSVEDKENICGNKYRITCDKCGNISHRNRLTESNKYWYKNNGYTCRKCKGQKFEIIDLKKGVAI